jgi:hypothetical protein
VLRFHERLERREIFAPLCPAGAAVSGACQKQILPDNKNMSKTLHEIEEAIGTLPLPERIRLYKDMPQLIGRSAEDLDWQRLGIENFFQDDSPEDNVYDSI